MDTYATRSAARPLERADPPANTARTVTGALALLVYLAAIVGANWAIHRYGIVAVGLGQRAPAGVFFAGLTFVARDLIQQALGRRPAVIAIGVGAALSAAISPTLAVASGTSFLISETADFLVYTPLASRGRLVLAVLVANTVGLALDTTVFLAIAFSSLASWGGTALGKAYMTLAALPVVWLLRRRLRPWMASSR